MSTGRAPIAYSATQSVTERARGKLINKLKAAIGSAVCSSAVQASLLGPLVRRTLRAADRVIGMSPDMKVQTQITDRPHYAYCLLNAALLAKRLGKDRISAIEFGVAGGNGLVFMVAFAEDIRRRHGVRIDCYGFDTGAGMPPPESAYDLPYWFRAQQYRMDEAALRRRLPEATLILGNVRDTVPGFLDAHDPSPIGTILNDTDYHSSTRDSLALFDFAKSRPSAFLPRVFLYFHDLIGSEYEMYVRSNGQLRAIREYSEKDEFLAIDLNQNLMPRYDFSWRYQIYYAHLFSHPDYGAYVGAGRQDAIESALRLGGVR